MPLNQHEQFLRKKRNKKIFRWSLIGFLIVFFVGSLSYISHRPRIRISKITLSGNVVVSEADVASATIGYIRGSYFWLFPKNNVFLYPNASLQKYLKENFPRIATADVHESNFNTLNVAVTERVPVGMWCDTLSTFSAKVGTTTEAQNGNCYFLDMNSFVFAPAPDFSGSAYFKYYGLFGTTTPIGNYYIASTTEFSDINDFIQSTRGLSLQPTSLVGKDDGTFALLLASGAQIYFDTTDSLSKTAQNLEALLRTPALSQNISKLDYIDMRFGNKLYYKLK